MKKFKSSRVNRWFYMGFLSLALFGGTLPAFLSFKIDPYEMFGPSGRGKAAAEKAEKAHYPLWKFSHYPGNARLVVLGDSRARSLRDKYWHEFGEPDAYNFAYGGGTIPEIYTTFQKIKNEPNLKTLVVGVQLRSFDEKHKGGMNRVPEAIKVTSSPVNYVKNWFVIRNSWEIFKNENPEIVRYAKRLVPQVLTKANAADLGKPGTTTVDTLLLPDVCFGCDLPREEKIFLKRRTKGPNLGLGRGDRDSLELAKYGGAGRTLPGVFKKQVERNARSDWKAFQFSKKYFEMIQEIASWADAHPDRNLIFVIPPTLVEMQQTISRFGLGAMDEQLRRRLAELAPVVDLDFPNRVTANLKNFSDAYHFNAEVARSIVGEVLRVSGINAASTRLIEERRGAIECPVLRDVETGQVRATTYRVFEGQSCRIWERI